MLPRRFLLLVVAIHAVSQAGSLATQETGLRAKETRSESAHASLSGSTEPLVDRDERDLPEGWYARIETSLGTILARLHPEQAPQSVAHFAGLAEGALPWTDVVTGETRQNHYYDGLIVHRADAGRQFEVGDPYGTGSRSPSMYVPPEVGGPINFSQPWKLGMTRAPLGRISGAQFFITAASMSRLSHRHPCFGTVVKGQEVVFRITSVRTYSNGKPVEPVTIHRIRIFKNGDPGPLAEPVAYQPKALKLEMRKDLPRK